MEQLEAGTSTTMFIAGDISVYMELGSWENQLNNWCFLPSGVAEGWSSRQHGDAFGQYPLVEMLNRTPAVEPCFTIISSGHNLWILMIWAPRCEFRAFDYQRAFARVSHGFTVIAGCFLPSNHIKHLEISGVSIQIQIFRGVSQRWLAPFHGNRRVPMFHTFPVWPLNGPGEFPRGYSWGGESTVISV